MDLARWRLPVLILLAVAATTIRANATRFYTEDLRIPMAAAGPQGLEAFLVRPAGTKRYPLALLSPGSPRSFDDRATMSAHKYYGIALEYARRGCGAATAPLPAGAPTASAAAPARPTCRPRPLRLPTCAQRSNGGYGWRSGRATTDDARRDSLAACMKWSPTCTPYAVDDQLVSGAQKAAADHVSRAR
ncbi:hypothetical protein [Bradyrhizobium campsiandrae]|uniref:hypothetical protein n=1 Tax=Bradyrhizobium campsiandrae TaxID=1729892 RepID=UPI003F679E0B